MSVPIDDAAVVKVARNLGVAGKPLPAALRDNPAALAAYNEGAGKPVAGFHPPAQPARKQPARKQPSRPASTRPAKKATPGYARRAVSPSAAFGRVSGSSPVTRARRAGDAGGLLLALVVYPVVLATIKYGAAGPGDWFRAKWLNNETPTPPAAGGAPPPPAANLPPTRTVPNTGPKSGTGPNTRKPVTS